MSAFWPLYCQGVYALRVINLPLFPFRLKDHLGLRRPPYYSVNYFPGPLLPLFFVCYTPKTPVFGDLLRWTPANYLQLP